MANINVKFNNKDYLLSCDDGQEKDLINLTKFLDKKYTDLKDKLGNIGENKLLLITSIQVIDEYFDLKKRVTSQKDSFEKQQHLLKNGKAVVVISENGLDAGSAGVELQKIGIEEVYLLRNGLISWKEESLPQVK